MLSAVPGAIFSFAHAGIESCHTSVCPRTLIFLLAQKDTNSSALLKSYSPGIRLSESHFICSSGVAISHCDTKSCSYAGDLPKYFSARHDPNINPLRSASRFSGAAASCASASSETHPAIVTAPSAVRKSLRFIPTPPPVACPASVPAAFVTPGPLAFRQCEDNPSSVTTTRTTVPPCSVQTNAAAHSSNETPTPVPSCPPSAAASEPRPRSNPSPRH